MRKYSQSFKQRKSVVRRKRSSSGSKPKRSAKAKASKSGSSQDSSGFLAAWRELLGGSPVPSVAQRRGRKPRVPLPDVLAALVFHVMNATGTLAEHFATLFEDALNDSACSDRRARLPWQVFADLMRRLLRPLAQQRRHPEAFWRSWRLVALDGTQH